MLAGSVRMPLTAIPWLLWFERAARWISQQYGLPLIVIPQTVDQFFVVQRVEALRTRVFLDRR